MLIIFGFFVMIFMFFFIGKLSDMAQVFINLPSVALIVIPFCFYLIASKSGKITGKYIKFSFAKAHAWTANELDSICAAMKNTIKFILAMGIFCFIAGLIVCLGYLGTPERFGPNLAVSLCTLVYSIAISFFVFFPVQAWTENKINKLPEEK
jgi:flagellar motor component MotA